MTIPKIPVRWRHLTIPCKYSDLLTPAMLIDAIRLSPQVGQDTLAKATLTLPNDLSAKFHLHATLCSQGICAGAVVTLMTRRHAKVLDPYGGQNYIAYQIEDKIQGFIGAIQYISPIPLLSELEVCHEGSPLDPTLQVQECNLPQELSLHVRFRSHTGGQPHQEPVLTESAPTAGNVPGATKTSSPPVTGPQDHQLRTQQLTHGLDDTGSTRSLSPSQTFVPDLRGRTHVVPFQSTDSITTNLLRYSLKLSLPPLEEIYILAGRRILKIEYTELDNGLHSEPHLTIMLRCRGGMKNGAISSSRGKGRGGQRASEGSSRGMGGGQTTMENSRPPLGKVKRGRGRGLRSDAKRPTVLHTQSPADMDDISRHALTIARMDALHTHTARLCQERWESFCTALDYGPPPPAADQERLPEDMPKASEDQPNQVSSTLQGALDHHHTAEDPWNPIWTEPPSGTRLEPVGDTTPGPLKDYPDQPNRVPSTPQSALPLPEPEATTNSPSNMYGFSGQELVNVTGRTPSVPSEASTEPPTQPEGDDTTTPTDNHDWGSPERKGHIADGSDKGRLKKDPKKQQTYQSDRSAPGRCS